MSSQSIAQKITDILNSKTKSFLNSLIVVLLCWTLYRLMFNLPIWIDEVFAKTVFFLLPAILYTRFSHSFAVEKTLSIKHLNFGLVMGTIFGGLLGFLALLLNLNPQTQLSQFPIFLTFNFWYSLTIGIFTAFFESIFFFGWIFMTSESIFKHYPKWRILVFNSLIFTIFHVVNLSLGYQASFGPLLAFLLTGVMINFLFSLGQGLLFLQYRNLYILIVSHVFFSLSLSIFS